jgi:hypothetical protein
MPRKYRNRPMHNRTRHLYGLRSQQCPRCKLLLRPEDFEGDVCRWCVFDLSEAARKIAALHVPLAQPA